MTNTQTKSIDIHSGELVLVNAATPLRDFEATGLRPVAMESDGEVLLAPAAARMLHHCVSACGLAGSLLAVSGYRTKEEQQQIYADSLAENGPEFTAKYVALPGCSEHQTGLAIDLGENRPGQDFICPDLPRGGIFSQFRKAAAEFGFIERYPEDKTHITGIGYEPWHFRYVGWPHSSLMVQHGLCLEEYIALLAEHGPGRPLEYHKGSGCVQVFSAQPQEAAALLDFYTENGRLIRASGDNVGRAVLSLWK